MLVKIEEIAEMLSMNKNSIYKLIYRNDIPYTKIGGTYRFDKNKIVAWINQNSYDMIKPKSKRL